MTREVYDKATEIINEINKYEKAIEYIENEPEADVLILIRPNYALVGPKEIEAKFYLYDKDRKSIIDFMKEKLKALEEELEKM